MIFGNTHVVIYALGHVLFRRFQHNLKDNFDKIKLYFILFHKKCFTAIKIYAIILIIALFLEHKKEIMELKLFKQHSAANDSRLKLCLILAIFALCTSIALAQTSITLDQNDMNMPVNVITSDAVANISAAGTYGLVFDTSGEDFFFRVGSGYDLTFNNTGAGIVTLRAMTMPRETFNLLYANGMSNSPTPSSINLNGDFDLFVKTDDATERVTNDTVSVIKVAAGAEVNAQNGALNIKMNDVINFPGDYITVHKLYGLNVGDYSTANLSGPLSIDITRDDTDGSTAGIFSEGATNITNDIDIKITDKTTRLYQNSDKYTAGIFGSVNVNSDKVNIDVKSSDIYTPVFGYAGDNQSYARFNAKEISISAAYTDDVEGSQNFAIALTYDSVADFNYGNACYSNGYEENGQDLENTVKLDGNILSVSNAILNINLTNDESYLKGWLTEDYFGQASSGTINILFKNGATWYADAVCGEMPRYFDPLYLPNTAHAIFNGGVIDLAWKEKERVEKLIALRGAAALFDTRTHRTIILDSAKMQNVNDLVVNTDLQNNVGDKFVLNNLNMEERPILLNASRAVEEEIAKIKTQIDVKVEYDPLLLKYIEEEMTGKQTFEDFEKLIVMEILRMGETELSDSVGIENIVEYGISKYSITPELETEVDEYRPLIYNSSRAIAEPRDLQTANIKITKLTIEKIVNGGDDDDDDGGDDDDDGCDNNNNKYKVTVVVTAEDTVNMLRNSSRLMSEDLLYRLDDIRRDNEGYKSNVWAKVYGAKHKTYSAQSDYTSEALGSSRAYYAKPQDYTISQNFIGGQLGLDSKTPYFSHDLYFGGFVDILTSDNSYVRGNGNMENIGGGLYASLVAKNGQYLDLVGRYGKIDGNFDIRDTSHRRIKADFDTNSLALSAEYGYKVKVNDGFSIEPQAQYSYTRISGFDYRASNNVNFMVDDIESNIGRLGVRLQDEGEDGYFYLGADYLYDFAKDTVLRASYGKDKQTIVINNHEDWYKLLVGGAVDISDSSNIYGEASTLLGDNINNSWKLDLGVRINF